MSRGPISDYRGNPDANTTSTNNPSVQVQPPTQIPRNISNQSHGYTSQHNSDSVPTASSSRYDPMKRIFEQTKTKIGDNICWHDDYGSITKWLSSDVANLKSIIDHNKKEYGNIIENRQKKYQKNENNLLLRINELKAALKNHKRAQTKPSRPFTQIDSINSSQQISTEIDTQIVKKIKNDQHIKPWCFITTYFFKVNQLKEIIARNNQKYKKIIADTNKKYQRNQAKLIVQIYALEQRLMTTEYAAKYERVKINFTPFVGEIEGHHHLDVSTSCFADLVRNCGYEVSVAGTIQKLKKVINMLEYNNKTYKDFLGFKDKERIFEAGDGKIRKPVIIILAICQYVGNIGVFAPAATGWEKCYNLWKTMYDEKDIFVLTDRFGLEPSAQGIMKSMQYVRNHIENSGYEYDGVILFGMGFGNEDQLMGQDGEYIDIEAMFNIFNRQKCRKLGGKPKIGFFNLCSDHNGVASLKRGRLRLDWMDDVYCHISLIKQCKIGFCKSFSDDNGYFMDLVCYHMREGIAKGEGLSFISCKLQQLINFKQRVIHKLIRDVKFLPKH